MNPSTPQRIAPTTAHAMSRPPPIQYPALEVTRPILADGRASRQAAAYWTHARRVLALFGPTGVGKTDVAIALAERLRARGERPVAVSADALQVYAGLEILTGVPSDAQRARLEHRLISFLPVDRALQRRRVRRARPRRDRRPARRGRDADRRRRHRPVPARGARRARAAPAAARGRARALGGRARRAAAPRRCTPRLARAAPWAAETIDPRDRHRIVRSLELLEQGALERAATGPTACGPTTRAIRPASSASTRDRDELYARIERRVDAMVAAGAAEEVRRADAAGASADRARRARLRGAARRRRRRDEAAHAPLRAPPAHVDAQAARRRARRHRRARRRRTSRPP